MKFINSHILKLNPYKVASHSIWEVDDKERESILKLDWNEGVISPSPIVYKRINELMVKQDIFRLYPPTCNYRLISALSDYTKVPSNCIQYFASSDSLQEYLSRAVLNYGDKVVLLGPTYDNFRLTAEVQGAEIIIAEQEPPFKFDEQWFSDILRTTKPKLVYICNPNNPTGWNINKSIIENFLIGFPEILFFIDEAYIEFGGESVSELVTTHDNLVISRTFSKAFCLAGFRIGYMISSPSIIEGVSRIRNSKNITIFAQEAAIAVLEDIGYMLNYVRETRINKHILEDFFANYRSSIIVYPSVANFILIRVDDVEKRNKLSEILLQHKIYTRILTHSKKLENCIRITIPVGEFSMDKLMGCFKQTFD